MLKELNIKQIRSFFLLLMSLQKKNTIFGFVIGLVPILVTAFSIELFIGRIIGGEAYTPGLKATNALFFIFFSSAISQSTEALKNYGSIIKNSYLKPTTVMVSETLLQYFSFITSLIIIVITFAIPLETASLIFFLSLLLLFYTLAITNYILVASSVLEDFGRVLGIVFQMLFWISPILYSVRIIKSDLVYGFMANPFYIFFELVYLVFLPQAFDPLYFWPGVISAVCFLIVLVLAFSNLRKKMLVFL
jgi:lipopolysaccharide transport system permease protein